MVSQWQSKAQDTGEQRVAPGREVATSDSSAKMVAITTNYYISNYFLLIMRHDILRLGKQQGKVYFSKHLAYAIENNKHEYIDFQNSKEISNKEIFSS